MASVSVPGMSGWGNCIHRCQAPLHSLRLTGRCQGAFVCWAGNHLEAKRCSPPGAFASVWRPRHPPMAAISFSHVPPQAPSATERSCPIGTPGRMTRSQPSPLPKKARRRRVGLVVRSCLGWCPAPVTDLAPEPGRHHSLAPPFSSGSRARQGAALRKGLPPAPHRQGDEVWTSWRPMARGWMSIRRASRPVA